MNAVGVYERANQHEGQCMMWNCQESVNVGTCNISRLGGQALGLLQGDSARGASASPWGPRSS